MKLNKKLSALALACALTLGLAAIDAAKAQPPAYPAPGYQALTPEQQTKARQIFQEHYAAMESTRQALALKRAELDNQLASPNPDRGIIETLSREVGELRGKMLSDRVALRAELEKHGLSTDLYAPDAPQRGPWDGRPEVWRHGRGHGHHGYGWRGWRGCWNGCMY